MNNKNFLQSQLWRDINTKVFWKTIFDFELLWNSYFWFVKEKKKWFLKSRWYQVLWVSFSDFEKDNIQKFKKEIRKIKRDFRKSYFDIFFQLWFVDEISRYSISEIKKNKDFLQDIKEKRENWDGFMKKELWLSVTIRENMPLATVFLDLSLPFDDIKKDFSSSVKRHINKAKKEKIGFEIASNEDWNKFYKIWEETAKKKGFNIIPRKTFFGLKEFLLSSNTGNLFVLKKDKEIINGNIYVFWNDWLYYLYWWTNRYFWNIWWGYFLKSSLIQWWQDKGFKFLDMFWVAPSWCSDHHLEWVSRFKQWFWWKKIEYLWNYDVVFNNALYKFYDLIKNRKFRQ